MDQIEQTVQGLPQFTCHKVVRASKILRIHPMGGTAVHLELDATPALIPVSGDWQTRHQPEPGGYLVVYEDGYMSYSPAKAFEAGYTRVPAAADLAQEPILQYFTFEHLPERLQAVSRPFAEMAMHVIMQQPRSPERTVALRKLLECKDATVRAALAKS